MLSSITSPFTLAIAAAAVVYFLILIWRQVSSPLRSVPGPMLARFTDLWYIWKLRAGDFHRINLHLHEVYGPIVRYGPNRYSLNHVEATSAIYSHKSPFQKSRWYFAWGQVQQWTLFSDDDNERHAQNRRQFQSLYSMSSLVNYEPYVDECISIFRQRLGELAHANLPMNMGHWMQCYAFDVISLITYSKRIGFLDRGEDVGGVMGALDNFLSYASLAGLLPSLHPYMVRFKNWLAGSKGTGRAYVVNFTKKRVAEHQDKPKLAESPDDVSDDDMHQTGKLDLLSKFYARHTKDPDSFTAYHVIAGCTQNMVAGSDTTAITLSACLYYLLKNPHTFARLRSEVDQFRREHNAKRTVNFKESQEMPYLQAVIKETLRMHPATGLPLERVVPKGGATICGCFFPEGTIIGVNSWVEHRNPQIWGDDANEFKPERWLIDDSNRLAFMNRHWMPFGLASRVCIGKHISLLEICMLMPSLVGDFDFELDGRLADPKTEWNVTDYWFVKPTDFMVRVKLRETQAIFKLDRVDCHYA